jgi:hypothetical protein
VEHGGLAQGLKAVAFDGQQQAMQEDGQGQARPDADAWGVSQETLVKPLYGGSNRPNNHEEGTWVAKETGLAADFFLPPGALFRKAR